MNYIITRHFKTFKKRNKEKINIYNINNEAIMYIKFLSYVFKNNSLLN